MKYFTITVLFCLATCLSYNPLAYGQKSYEKRYMPYSIKKERAAPENQKKIYNKIQKWMKNTKGIQLVRFNQDEFKLEAEGVLLYENEVILENIFLSRDANLRTKGTIKFKITVECLDGKYKVDFTDFVHEAFYNRYGKISFGGLLMNDNVPLKKCYENTEWCNAVWKDMKDKSRKHVTGLWIDLQKAVN